MGSFEEVLNKVPTAVGSGTWRKFLRLWAKGRGRSIAEAARLCGIKPSTARNKVARFRSALKGKGRKAA